jgi:hypothetical protein
VRQARPSGANGLGQGLKSWRDRSANFAAYREASDYLASLGPAGADGKTPVPFAGTEIESVLRPKNS